jgi:hypothetical protein
MADGMFHSEDIKNAADIMNIAIPNLGNPNRPPKYCSIEGLIPENFIANVQFSKIPKEEMTLRLISPHWISHISWLLAHAPLFSRGGNVELSQYINERAKVIISYFIHHKTESLLLLCRIFAIQCRY